MIDFTKIPGGVWATIIGVGTVGAAITSMLAIWDQIDNNIQSSIQTATVLVTQEIQDQTGIIVEFIEDDLYERIIILESDIDDLKAKNQPIPTQKVLQLKSMKERLSNFKQRHD